MSFPTCAGQSNSGISFIHDFISVQINSSKNRVFPESLFHGILYNDAGISDKTAKSWLSILETCYLVHFVRPHFANFGKRLIKAPKLYMSDVGLAAALLGIQTAQQMAAQPLRGAFFETMVVNEFLKSRANAGLRETLYFWRDNIGTEVDLVLERGTEIAAIEMKSATTVASDAFGNLKKWHKYASERGRDARRQPADRPGPVAAGTFSAPPSSPSSSA